MVRLNFQLPIHVPDTLNIDVLLQNSAQCVSSYAFCTQVNAEDLQTEIFFHDERIVP